MQFRGDPQNISSRIPTFFIWISSLLLILRRSNLFYIGLNVNPIVCNENFGRLQARQFKYVCLNLTPAIVAKQKAMS